MTHDNTRKQRLLEILENSVSDARIDGLDKTHVDYWRVILDELDKENAPTVTNNGE